MNPSLSDQLAIFGLILGIVGIGTSLYFYLVSRQIKKPLWVILSNNLVEGYSSKLQKLSVLYNKKPIQNLTISHVAFWNAGNLTINADHLETINPLKIISKGASEILDVTVLKSNNTSNDFRPKKIDKHNCRIFFDYLDKNNGAVFKIVHTGLSSKDIDVIGDIKGSTSIKCLMKVSSQSLKSVVMSFGIWFVFSGILFVYSIFSKNVVNTFMSTLIFLFYFLMMIFGLFGRIPSGLEPFFDHTSFLYKKKRLI